MKLAIYSHKPCWRSEASPSGFATDGGFPFQVAALSKLFDETVLVVPGYPRNSGKGEIGLQGKNLTVVLVPPPLGLGFARKLMFPVWIVRSWPTLWKVLIGTNAVHTPIPGDVGTIGMLLAFCSGKPLFVRHCGNWLRPKTVAEKLWRWFMEAIAGGRNIMMATGGNAEPPSWKNPNVRWVFSTSLTRSELRMYGSPRSYPGGSKVRLIIVARQEAAKGAGTVIQSLPRLAKRFPAISLDIVGDGSAIPLFKRLALEVGVGQRVRFLGKLNHEEVMLSLRDADLFVFPTTSSDGFPKAVLEALASGLPVVATGVSVLPQLIGNGGGFLIDAATPDAVAAAVEYLLAEPVRYEAVSRRAIETAGQYSLDVWSKCIGEILEASWGPLKSQKRRCTVSAFRSQSSRSAPRNL